MFTIKQVFKRSFTTNNGSQEKLVSFGLDPRKRVDVLKEEYQFNWGIGNYSSSNKIIEFQEKNHKFRKGIYKPEGKEKAEFDLQRRLALAAYHRAFVKCPKYLMFVHKSLTKD